MRLRRELGPRALTNRSAGSFASRASVPGQRSRFNKADGLGASPSRRPGSPGSAWQFLQYGIALLDGGSGAPGRLEGGASSAPLYRSKKSGLEFAIGDGLVADA